MPSPRARERTMPISRSRRWRTSESKRASAFRSGSTLSSGAVSLTPRFQPRPSGASTATAGGLS